ncbi:MAG: ABC transporter permease [Acidobacteria bacterium]|nr:ABC transporter permease [Acidobacteriota bacterium]
MRNFFQDLRYAIRAFRKTPVLTAGIVLTLAIGIGGNTAVFTVVNAVLLRPLPYPASEQLVQVMRSFPDKSPETTSATQFLFWRSNSQTLSKIAAYDLIGSGLNLSGTSEPERVNTIRVSSDFFKVLQVNPALGRDFTLDDEWLTGARVVILSNGLWQRRFGSDPGIIGKPITLSGESYTVIGVAPPDFTFSPASDLWTPLRAVPDPTDQANLFKVVGRMKPGASLAQVQADMMIIGNQFRNTYPDLMNQNEGIRVRSYHSSLVGDARTPLLILVGVVAFVLLIACFNIVNLLLSRSIARRKEITLRVALGATTQRIIRQLLTESLLLAMVGCVLGVLLSFWGLPLLLALSPSDLPLLGRARIDFNVLLFALLLALLSTLIFGLAPALVATRVDLNTLLKEASQAIGGRRKRLFQSTLVVGEVSLTIVLLAGAALLIQSYILLNRIEPGFDPHNVLTMQMSLSGSRYNTTSQVNGLYQQVAPSLRSLPGVQAVATVTNLPTEKGPGLPFEVVGDPNGAGDAAGDTQWRAITPDYLTVMRIPVLRGRAFNDADMNNGAPVVIINEALAKRYWKNRDPLEENIVIGREMGPKFADAPRKIVGIVGNVRELGLEAEPPPTIFVPTGQIPDAYTQLVNRVVPLTWVIRTSGRPTDLVKPVRSAVLAIDSQQPVANFRPLEQVLSKTIARQHFNMLLLTLFAVIALILSSVGLYSLLSFSVTERTHEIGIRMALGARPRSLVLLILNHALKLVLIGSVIGVFLAFVLTRLLATLLFKVNTTDPLVFVIVITLLVLVALVASYIPARRAALVDPLIALRQP